MSSNSTRCDATRLIHTGPSANQQAGAVNPPIYRASTIIYDNVENYVNRRRDRFFDGVMYGLYGTPTAIALAQTISDLERAEGTVLTGSGTAAIACVLSSFVKTGEHILLADSVYGQTRDYCEEVLSRFGIEISYFEPTAAAEIEHHIRPNTRLLFLESPGSNTFEMIDIPQVLAVTKKHGVLTAIDNTWASPLFYKPLEAGIDISIQSGTKYISGHSDAMLGSISTGSRKIFEVLKKTAGINGHRASPDDCALVHRGIRTLEVRLKQHQKTALELMNWFSMQPEVAEILSPAWEDNPGYQIWRRDFTGASGLFGVTLYQPYENVLTQLIESLELFQIGSSWGGYESLIVPVPAPQRRYPNNYSTLPLIRIHAGLENTADLIADLEHAFAILRKQKISKYVNRY